MGAFYFDQGLLILALNPTSWPIFIPETGGNVSYTLEGINRAPVPVNIDIWCNLTLPGGQMFGPVMGPFAMTIPANSILSRIRDQWVPAHAPAGEYLYHGYIGDFPDSILFQDSFPFTKSGTRSGVLEVGDWTNSGESFVQDTKPVAAPEPARSNLIEAQPNPFNPTTAISFELRAASHVSLKVYDTSGRVVATLVDGWREAGISEVTFDGSKLASGVYLYRLETSDQSAAGKMVLLK
jgi:hypothetical protein